MKILIAYYSRTGHTEKLSEVLKKELENRGHSVDVEKVKPVKERSFWAWFLIRIFKDECEIQAPKIKDVSQYDAICIGSPNWTQLSLPMARYLKEVEGLRYKNVSLFATTAAPPALEWYFLSALFLDLTFARIVEAKRGRVVDSILLSSAFKKWNFESEYGKEKIKSFCDKVIAPLLSYKDYVLKQKETEDSRTLVIIFSTFLVLSLISHIFLDILNKAFLDWKQYSYFAAIFFLTSFLLITLQQKKAWLFLGKYIGIFFLILLWTLIILYIEPFLKMGMIILWGYILIFITASFFREQKVVIFSGLLSLLSYGILFYILPVKEIFRPSLDLALLTISWGAIILITNNLRRYYYGLLEIQDEIEMARATLEIKVAVRTRELRELAEGLDEQVKEKTKELQERVNELEKFHRLIVGRELKMIELKGEIKKLKKELEK